MLEKMPDLDSWASRQWNGLSICDCQYVPISGQEIGQEVRWKTKAYDWKWTFSFNCRKS